MAVPASLAAARNTLRNDGLIALACAAVAGLYLLTHTHRGSIPMEDASMLLRYSLHLAQGYGIRWNPGMHPVEGATDFLYMFVIGAGARLTHASVFAVGRSVLVVSHLLTVAALYFGARRLFNAPVAAAVFVAALSAFGQAYHFVDTMFSAPFFGAAALAAWLAVQTMARRGITFQRALLFSLATLVLGLIRPEGNFIAVYMLGAALYLCRDRRKLLFVTFALVFAVLGGAYFVWRWHYFGHPLPNPFYVKHTASLRNAYVSTQLLAQLTLPALPLLGLGFATREGRRALAALAIVVVPFCAMWASMSLDNNGYLRFQYVLVPVILLSVADAITVGWAAFAPLLREHEAARRAALGLAAALSLVALYATSQYDRHIEVNTGAYELAMRLHPLAAHGDSMVSTEAGTLPLYSDWRAVDALGLNDEFLAHNGGNLTFDYLEQYKPDLLLYKAHLLGPEPTPTAAQLATAKLHFDDRTPLVAATMRAYALSHGYTLAAVYAAEYCNFHYIWVRTDSPDAAAILSAVRDYPYGWQGSGAPTYDFRAEDGHNTCPVG
jgi:hypothetical protein